jgi:sulfoxide reductase heme-binding subunit YedZ
MANSTLWYMARGTGVVSVILLSLSVGLGILTTMRWSTPSWPRFVTSGLHKNVSLLAVTFLGVHIVSTLLDTKSPVHLGNALVPFTGTYRPLAIGLGVVAFDLLAALIVTSLLRQRIGYRAWRAVHSCAYACWPFAMLHGLTAGTDTGSRWTSVVYLVCGVGVLAAVAWRAGAVVAESRTVAVRAPYQRVSR